MRLLHISDLHFGAHNQALATSLLGRAKELKPDVILCTGDLVEEPKKPLLEEAQAWLQKLQAECAFGSKLPKLLVVPGNHDYRSGGWRSQNEEFWQTFKSDERELYFPDENVWIFGFDSAHDGAVGGSGKIDTAELGRFHERCDALERDANFRGAFKIVVVHHHPLPVNRDGKWQDRWLTMTNAGAFLAAVLFRRVDLVLHGHEHIQARARLWSSLGANDHELAVVSLGSTLRCVTDSGRNWFGLVDTNAHGVQVDFYASVGPAFNRSPEGPPFVVRSRSRTDDQRFEHWVSECGFFHQGVGCITELTAEGDARMTVQHDRLRFSRHGSERAKSHPMCLESQSGYLADLRASSKTVNVAVGRQIPKGQRAHSFPTDLRFSRPLTTTSSADYSYQYSDLNSFAMNRYEFKIIHKDVERFEYIEFTHYQVADPIERLTVMVKFPPGFRPPRPPRLRVMRLVRGDDGTEEWEIDVDIQNRLQDHGALRYYETLGIALAEVCRPLNRLRYGIEWDVPDAPGMIGAALPRPGVSDVRRLWEAGAQNREGERAKLHGLLAQLVVVARKVITPGWRGPLEASFMYWDGDRNLKVLCAALLDSNGMGQALEEKYVTHFRYGDGVPGRAFKLNSPRWHIAGERVLDSEALDCHLPLTEPDRHEVVLAMPVRLPRGHNADTPLPYGVFTLASTSADCPLAQLGLPNAPATQGRLLAFQKRANKMLHDSLSAIFSADPRAPGAPDRRRNV